MSRAPQRACGRSERNRKVDEVKAILLILVVLLTGCATPDFKAQLATYEKVETTRSGENKAKYDSLGAIAANASDATKQVALQAWQAVAMADSLGGGRKAYEPMPQAPETAFDKTLKAISIIAPVAANITGSVMSYKLGTNQAQYSRDIALGDQASRVATVATVANGMASLGNSGLNAAVSLGTRPTTVVTGNGNAVNGSTADNSTTTTTTTNTNNCTSGQAGSSSGTTGSPAGGPSGQVPCTISK